MTVNIFLLPSILPRLYFIILTVNTRRFKSFDKLIQIPSKRIRSIYHE